MKREVSNHPHHYGSFVSLLIFPDYTLSDTFETSHRQAHTPKKYPPSPLFSLPLTPCLSL
jgi:hypothetical protein